MAFHLKIENKLGNGAVAYISGAFLDHGRAKGFVGRNGEPHFIKNNGSRLNEIPQNECVIQLNKLNSVTSILLPRMEGGRVYTSNKSMTFYTNPGPSIVEPNAANEKDANYHLDWSFFEFTYNHTELYANISAVDFVSRYPIGLKLESYEGTPRFNTVIGLKPNGLDLICSGLISTDAEHQRVHGKKAGWSRLIIRSNDNKPLRAIAPVKAMEEPGKRDLFHRYYDAYVDQVYDHYRHEPMVFDTELSWGKWYGKTEGNRLIFRDDRGNQIGAYPKPTTLGIFAGDREGFQPQGRSSSNIAQNLHLIPRLNAGYNRSTLLINRNQPDNLKMSKRFYQNPTTNHYSRLVHEHFHDGKGYGFAYDDVRAKDWMNNEVSGFVKDPKPKLLTVTVGRPKPANQRAKRSIAWDKVYADEPFSPAISTVQTTASREPSQATVSQPAFDAAFKSFGKGEKKPNLPSSPFFNGDSKQDFQETQKGSLAQDLDTKKPSYNNNEIDMEKGLTSPSKVGSKPIVKCIKCLLFAAALKIVSFLVGVFLDLLVSTLSEKPGIFWGSYR